MDRRQSRARRCLAGAVTPQFTDSVIVQDISQSHGTMFEHQVTGFLGGHVGFDEQICGRRGGNIEFGAMTMIVGKVIFKFREKVVIGHSIATSIGFNHWLDVGIVGIFEQDGCPVQGQDDNQENVSSPKCQAARKEEAWWGTGRSRGCG